MNIPKINKRERILLVAFAAVMIIALYYRGFFMPSLKKAQSLDLQLQQLQRQAQDIQNQFPDLTADKDKYEATQKEIKTLKNELSNLEVNLFDSNDLPELIKDVSQPKPQEYNVEFLSLKPVELAEKKPYDSLEYEINVRAEFSDIVKYLRRIKDIFPTARINSIKLNTSDKEVSLLNQATLGLTILVGKSKSVEKVNFSQEAKTNDLQAAPFFSSTKSEMLKKSISSSIKLDGIIFNGKNSIAIIDNEAVKLNGTVKGKKVVEIKADSVILEQSGTKYELTLE
jgi:Tfp pilus assembly protein PilO